MRTLILTALIVGVRVIPISQGLGEPVERVIQKNSPADTQPTQNATEKQKSADSEAIRAILAAVSQIQQEAAQQREAEKSVKDEGENIERKLVTYTKWLVIVGILQALVLAGTVWAIVKQTGASKASQRAWALIERVGNPVENWRFSSNMSYVPGIVFEFKSYGTTPIKVIEGAFELTLIPNKKGIVPPAPDLPEIPDYSKAFPLPRIVKDGIPLAPGANYQIRRILSLTTQQMEAVNNYEIILCGYGYLKYVDVFKRNRETRVCYIYFLQYGGVIRTPEGVVLNPEGFYVGGPPEYNKAT